jgi:hypothetical protein
MKRVFIIVVTYLLSGCVGLAVGTFGTFEKHTEKFEITDHKNNFGFAKLEYTKEDIIRKWGAPNEIYRTKNCEVLGYYNGYSWSGIGAFVLVLPIPLLLPSGHDESRFYFKNGKSVGLTKEYGEITSAFGFMCGSNECKFMAGKPKNKDSQSAEANEKWCE